MHELNVHKIELEIQNEELRQSQLDLDESREKYIELYDFAPVGYLTLNEKGVITMANLTAANLLGFSKAELVNSPLTKFIYKEDQDVFYLNRKKLLEAEKKQQFEIRFNDKDKTYFWAHIDAMLSRKDDEVFILVTLTDITEHKKDEEIIKNDSKFLKETQIIANLGIYTMDIIGDSWTSSDVLDKIFGIDSNWDKSTKGWASIIHPVWQDMMYKYFINEVVGNKKRFDKEYKIIRQNDKAERWVHGLGELKYNDKMQPVEMVGTIQDITERVTFEKEIELKNEKLIKLNSEKDKFFSIIAHDLRSPFMGFLGFTDLLQTDLYKMTIAELQEVADSLNTSANNLFGLLTNLLEWASMHRGVMEICPAECNLTNIVKDIFETNKGTIDKKEIVFKNDIPGKTTSYSDVKMTETIFRNLISNAIKFTNRKGVINVTSKPIDGSMIEVCVKDSGIGMDKELINNLFKLDVNTKRKGTNDEPSSGLGLILCKEFIEKQGGKIWMESEEGKGSKFYFSLKAVL